MRRLLAITASLLLAGCMTLAPERDRPASWARPEAASTLPNLYQVDAGLWRSALPDAEGFRAARSLGIRTVVNLRPHPDTLPADLAADAVHIPVQTWHVTQAQVRAFLRVAVDPARQPVLVHCWHGADRTGVMVAAYRVVVQGWPKPEAIREMQHGGYGYHAVWINLPGVIERLDVVAIRRELGLPPATPGGA